MVVLFVAVDVLFGAPAVAESVRGAVLPLSVAVPEEADGGVVVVAAAAGGPPNPRLYDHKINKLLLLI